jgi:hypothetical protein
VRFYLPFNIIIAHGLRAALYSVSWGGFADCGCRGGWWASGFYFVYIVHRLRYLRQSSNPVSFVPVAV